MTILTEIDNTVKSNKVMLFMKGSPKEPMCGFSAKVSGILNGMKVDYAWADVLQHPDVRQGIKEYAEWPTIPQLYIDGEFVGGCDIVTEMYLNGELEKLLTTNNKS